MSGRGRARYHSLQEEAGSPGRVPYSPDSDPRTGIPLRASSHPRDGEDQEQRDLTRYKRIKLFWLFMTSAAWAFDLCINGPTVPDMRERLGLTMEQFARSSVTGGIGWVLGALIGGLISDRYLRHADLIMSISLLGLGITLVLKPWSTSLTILCSLTAISGVFGGFLNTGMSAVHFGLFGAELIPAYIRGLGWTVSCPVVPLIAKDFLSDPVSELQGNATYNITRHSALGAWWTYGDNSRIEIPYAVSACVCLLTVPAFLYYYYAKPPKAFMPLHKEKHSWKEVFTPGSCGDGTWCFSLVMTICMVLYYVIYDASNNARWHLAFSYAIDPRAPLNMTKDEASYLATSGSLAHLFSRLLCLLLKYFVPGFSIQILMVVAVTGNCLSTAAYVFLGLRSVTWLWVSTILIDLFQQNLWIDAYLWLETYMHVYSIIVGLTDIGAGLAGMVASWVYGRMYDSDPALPFYVAFGFTLLHTLHFIGMQIFATCYSKHNSTQTGDPGYRLVQRDEDSQGLLQGDGEEEEEEDDIEIEVVNGKVRYLRGESGMVASSEGEDCR